MLKTLMEIFLKMVCAGFLLALIGLCVCMIIVIWTDGNIYY